MSTHVKNLSLLIEKLQGKKDIDYITRTRIEREFFLLLKDYCNCKLNYNLQGLEDEHKKELDECCIKKGIERSVREIIDDLFDLCYCLWGLTSSNPYVEWSAVAELGKDKAIKIEPEERFKRERELELKYGDLFPIIKKKDYYATKFDAICAFSDKVKNFINKYEKMQ